VRIKFFLSLMIVSAAASLLLSCGNNSTSGITSEKGSITLQNNILADKIISLDYNWEFYWKRLYTPEDFSVTKPVITGFIKVPGVWNGFVTGEGAAGGDGFATYRFTVKNIPAGSYGLKIPCMATAYKLWLNDKFIYSNGTVAADQSMVPQQMPTVAFFNTTGEDIVFTVQVSNYMSDKGGMWGSIYLGTAEQIIRMRIVSVGLDLLLFGSFLIMALYHFCLYAFRRKNRFILYFGLGCFVVALRVILTDEFFIVYMFPGINWNYQIRLEFITMIAGFILFFMFIKDLYSEEFSEPVTLFYQVISVIFTLMIAAIPVKLSAKFLPVYHITIVSGFIYMTYALVLSIKNRRDGALFIMTGYIVLVLAVINDMLDANNIIHTGYVLPYGLFIFIFSQSAVLSLIFSRSFNRVEELSGKLQVLYNRMDEYNKNLEAAIEERTHEISDANRRLLDLDRAKTDFFANISHEFRTPLTLMLAPLDEAISGKKLSRETLETMYRNGRNLLSLINDLLDISRITAGRMILEVSETDVSSLVGQCCSEMISSSKQKNINLVFHPSESKVNVYVDAERIAHVISNFFSNSFKFTDNGGSIDVTVSAEDDCALIRFTDTGCGIAADKIAIIFDRFSQADTGPKRRYEGTGIGLSLVKELVELHKGSVSVESRHISDYPDNHGTEFTVKLQMGRDHFNGCDYVVFNDANRGLLSMPYVRGIDGEPFNHKDVTSDIQGDVPSLLIVEDNLDIRKLLLKMLSRVYTVYEAANGLDAVKILDEKSDIDLVLSDIMMPGMDGHELIRWIRADERFEGLPVLFLTARAENFMKIEGLNLGAIDYITKPFNTDELILRIRNQMEFKKLRNYLSRNYELVLAKLRATNAISKTDDTKIGIICNFIKENFSEDLICEDLAAAVGLTPDTFNSMFNHQTGKTLLDYINDLRINEAIRRLAGSDETIIRISVSTGFDSLRTFNRVFKKATGLTPDEFRERKVSN